MSRGVAHPPERVLIVLALREQGRSIASIAAQCDLPPGTVSRWCRGLLSADARHLRKTGELRRRCDRCGAEAHDGLPASDYAYLLGIYLGDGCLGTSGQSVALRITMDAAYPKIIDEVADAILAVRGGGTVSRYSPRNEHCVALTSYTRAWLCLFPQHAPGKKQDRRIALEPWQLAIVREHPGRLARGLIQADGWRGVNRVRVKGRDYEYPRCQFSSRSDDIRRLFTDAMDQLGIEWRPWGRFHISIAVRRLRGLMSTWVPRHDLWCAWSGVARAD